MSDINYIEYSDIDTSKIIINGDYVYYKYTENIIDLLRIYVKNLKIYRNRINTLDIEGNEFLGDYKIFDRYYKVVKIIEHFSKKEIEYKISDKKISIKDEEQLKNIKREWCMKGKGNVIFTVEIYNGDIGLYPYIVERFPSLYDGNLINKVSYIKPKIYEKTIDKNLKIIVNI